eukprot:m.91577 g.91577  ORF g.91577 m.91577 type:complete len:315 (-) comp8493_c0_seq4:529-1473(-)
MALELGQREGLARRVPKLGRILEVLEHGIGLVLGALLRAEHVPREQILVVEQLQAVLALGAAGQAHVVCYPRPLVAQDHVLQATVKTDLARELIQIELNACNRRHRREVLVFCRQMLGQAQQESLGRRQPVEQLVCTLQARAKLERRLVERARGLPLRGRHDAADAVLLGFRPDSGEILQWLFELGRSGVVRRGFVELHRILTVTRFRLSPSLLLSHWCLLVLARLGLDPGKRWGSWQNARLDLHRGVLQRRRRHVRGCRQIGRAGNLHCKQQGSPVRPVVTNCCERSHLRSAQTVRGECSGNHAYDTQQAVRA